MRISKDLLSLKIDNSENWIKTPNEQYEDLLENSGFFKKYFYLIMFIIFYMSFVMGYIGYSIPFYLYDIDLKCIPEKSKGKEFDCIKLLDKYKTLKELENQKEYKIISNKKFESLSSVYKLYYDKKEEYRLIKSFLYLGASLTCFIFSFLADKFGKKLTIFLSIIISSSGTILIFFKINLYFDILMFIVMYAGCDYFFNISFIYINEICKNKNKLTYLAYSYGFWSFGGLFLNLISIPHINYRWLNLILLILLVISLIVSYFLIESPIYLIVNKKKTKAINLFKKINKFSKNSNFEKENNINEVNNFVQNFELTEKKKNKENNEDNLNNFEKEINRINRHPIIIIFKKFELLKRFLISIFFFTVVYIIYGMTMACIEQMGTTNININGIVLSVLEGAGYLINVPISNKVPRKKFLIYYSIGIFVLGIILISLNSFKEKEGDKLGFFSILFILISGIIKFIISGIITLEFIYISELFPTKVRIIACGMILFIARLGTFISPILAHSAELLKIHALIIPAFILGLTLPFFKFLPETKKKNNK